MTCHSAAEAAIEDVRAKQAKTNARTEQRFTGRGMPAVWYQKRRRSQGVAASKPPKFSPNCPPSPLNTMRGGEPVAVSALKLRIDLRIFRAKHRKCFFPFDAPPTVRSHCSSR